MLRRAWVLGWLLVACEAEPAPGVDAAGVEAADDAGREDARLPTCASADVLRQAALDAVSGPHEVFAEEECPLRRIAADRVWEPTVECRQFEECGCRIRPDGCHTNADCTARPHGVCIGFESDGNTIRYATCVYEDCLSNAECAADETCACSERGPRICVRADCRSNDDCATGHECLRTMSCASGPFGDYLCTSDADQCVTHEDCVNAGLGSWCERSGDHRVCTSSTCTD